jgi:hypothetical protein
MAARETAQLSGTVATITCVALVSSATGALRYGLAFAIDTPLPDHALSFPRTGLRQRRPERGEQEPGDCGSKHLDHEKLSDPGYMRLTRRGLHGFRGRLHIFEKSPRQ